MVYGIIVLVVLVNTLISVVIFYTSNKQGDLIMATLQDLQTKIDALTQAEAEREARDVAQDAVTTQQIAVLQQTVTDLQNSIASGSLSPANQAIVDSAVAKVQATIDSLNAADPTAPVIP